MNKKELALQYDRNEEYIKAIEAYEDYIATGDPDLEDFTNLCALYFFVMDGGVAAGLQLTKNQLNSFDKSFFELLDAGRKKFGEIVELAFWDKYYKWWHWGDEIDDCIELAKKSDSLSFFLICTEPDIERKKQYLPQCKILYEQVKDGGTTKKRHIASLLESSFYEIERDEKKKRSAGK